MNANSSLKHQVETNQINKLKDESYQIKLENSSLHSSLENAEVENQKLTDSMIHKDKVFREIEILNSSLSGEIQTLKLKSKQCLGCLAVEKIYVAGYS